MQRELTRIRTLKENIKTITIQSSNSYFFEIVLCCAQLKNRQEIVKYEQDRPDN